MASKYINKYPIPEEFPEILHNFAKELVRNKPEDILDFGIEYFKAMKSYSVRCRQTDNENNITIDKQVSPISLNEENPSKSRERSAQSINMKKSKQFVEDVLKESKEYVHRKEDNGLNIERFEENNYSVNKRPKLTDSNSISNTPENDDDKAVSHNYANTVGNVIAVTFVDSLFQKSYENLESEGRVNTT